MRPRITTIMKVLELLPDDELANVVSKLQLLIESKRTSIAPTPSRLRRKA